MLAKGEFQSRARPLVTPTAVTRPHGNKNFNLIEKAVGLVSLAPSRDFLTFSMTILVRFKFI